jgi:hypothetical protein
MLLLAGSRLERGGITNPEHKDRERPILKPVSQIKSLPVKVENHSFSDIAEYAYDNQIVISPPTPKFRRILIKNCELFNKLYYICFSYSIHLVFKKNVSLHVILTTNKFIHYSITSPYFSF